jgi:hypothetical protein
MSRGWLRGRGEGDDGRGRGPKEGGIGQAVNCKLSLKSLNHGRLVGVGLSEGLVMILLGKEAVTG